LSTENRLLLAAALMSAVTGEIDAWNKGKRQSGRFGLLRGLHASKQKKIG
jgi:hypothetical protein